jgi:D-alanyl-lipoteichoic acid acyltransferase DltB (MBOAT superfamily)
VQFDSTAFLVFLVIVFVAYHLVARSRRVQNLLLLAASFVFYGWWDWRFLGLLAFSAGVDYLAALAMAGATDARRRRAFLVLSLGTNLAILGVFKYAGFFAESLARLVPALAGAAGWPTLHLVLPVGISFYTFQSMAYAVDVYRGDVPAERDPLVYFAFIAFFPQLVAGPIERAGHLLPQFRRTRHLDAGRAREAVWLLTYGLFLKVAIANGLATFADVSFHDGVQSAGAVVLGTIAFGLQIYCDFNAYSLIARGAALLFGFELMWNFNLPYVATSLQDFWRRWHISLSTWLRDYLYRPLGGNRAGAWRTYRNLGVTMLLGGLWHGAAWNFVAWGALHGLALAVERAVSRARTTAPPRWLAWSLTITVVFAGWFLFRVPSWDVGWSMLRALGSGTWTAGDSATLTGLAILAAPVAACEAWQYRAGDLLAPLTLPPWRFALVVGGLLFIAFAMFGEFRYAFIYFQF